MNITDEMRDVLSYRMESIGCGAVTAEEADFILTDLAPLIAAEVVEACAKVADETARTLSAGDWDQQCDGAWCAAADIRRKVPMMFGAADARSGATP